MKDQANLFIFKKKNKLNFDRNKFIYLLNSFLWVLNFELFFGAVKLKKIFLAHFQRYFNFIILFSNSTFPSFFLLIAH